MKTNITLLNKMHNDYKGVVTTLRILPANIVDKKAIRIRPSAPKSEKQNFNEDIVGKFYSKNNHETQSEQQIKKDPYLYALKGLIFSPDNFTATKNEKEKENKNKNIIIELTKTLLSSNNMQGDNTTLTTSTTNTTIINNNNNSVCSGSSSNSSPQSNNFTLHDKLQFFKSVTNPKSISQFINIDTNQPVNFLPQKSFYNQKRKTLILDLDETLVHSSFDKRGSYDIVLNLSLDDKPQTIYVCKRPGVDDFLEKMSQLYELVIFTASIPEYANPWLNKLDIHKRISYRLFRQHCLFNCNSFIKDLRHIGRDLKDTIWLDNNPISYARNKENGIPIWTWYSDQSDCELSKLVPWLTFLAEVDDVREYIKQFVIGNYVNHRKVTNMTERSYSNYSSKENEGNKVHALFEEDKTNATCKNVFEYPEEEKRVNKPQNKKSQSILSSEPRSKIFFENRKKKHDFIFRKDKLNHKPEVSSNKSMCERLSDVHHSRVNISDWDIKDNLFNDKKYLEKYKHFYNDKPLSYTNWIGDEDYYHGHSEMWILPSNNYNSLQLKACKTKSKYRNFSSKNIFREGEENNIIMNSHHNANNSKYKDSWSWKKVNCWRGVSVESGMNVYRINNNNNNELNNNNNNNNNNVNNKGKERSYTNTQINGNDDFHI